MLDPHPYFSSNDVTCPKCGADNLSERELRPSGGCVHCTCSGCGEAAADLVDGSGGPVCEDCRGAGVLETPPHVALSRDGDPWCPDCTRRDRAALDGLVARAHVERPLVDYIPAWRDARTPLEHRVVAYTAAALGDLGVAGYLATALPARDGDRVERVLQAVCS